jgi:hypothetical protein
MIKNADIAQSAEHILGKDEVISSNLIISSRRTSVKGFCKLFTEVLSFAEKREPAI